MSRTRFIAALALAAAAFVGRAQEPHKGNPYDGTWIATWTTGMADLFEPQAAAEVTIANSGGTWRMLNARAAASCAQLDWPVEVIRATDKGLALSVHGSRALQGCRDFGVRLKRVSETRLEGTIGRTPIILDKK